MEVNKKQLADIFGASIRTIQNWQEQGMPVLRGGGKGNEVLYDSAAVIRWYPGGGRNKKQPDAGSQ
ncbi:TPA: terminase small subunit [Escherichia coli]|nr:terminase small subunit [Escherichia coli]HCL5671479.1 terminase small subunit [Escherichia coli]